jgi:hypothetical protein
VNDGVSSLLTVVFYPATAFCCGLVGTKDAYGEMYVLGLLYVE